MGQKECIIPKSNENIRDAEKKSFLSGPTTKTKRGGSTGRTTREK